LKWPALAGFGWPLTETAHTILFAVHTAELPLKRGAMYGVRTDDLQTSRDQIVGEDLYSGFPWCQASPIGQNYAAKAAQSDARDNHGLRHKLRLLQTRR
jgi:hypothetical protein